MPDQIEHLIHGRLCVHLSILGDCAQLLVYVAEQLARIEFGGQYAGLQTIEKAVAHPPEGAHVACLRHAAHHFVQYLLHRFHCGRSILLAQPFQQALLILPAQHLEMLRFTRRDRAQYLLRQSHGKIGIEQIHLERHLETAQVLQFLILRKQAQRGVVRPVGQRVQEVRDGEQCMMQHIAMHRGKLLGMCSKLAQHDLQFGAEYRRTIQSDHLQHTQHAVQFGAYRLKRSGVFYGCGEIQIHFRTDLGQRCIQAGLQGGKCIGVELCVIGHVLSGSDYSLKRVTEPLKSEASLVSCSTELAVRRVPSVVCTVTWRISCIACATSPAMSA